MITQPHIHPDRKAVALPSAFELSAGALADVLLRRAVRTETVAAWTQPALADGKPRVLPPHLFGGSTGIAYFLAAWAAVSGCEASRRTALAAVAPLRRSLSRLAAEDADGRSVRHLGGGFLGMGSFLYALSHISVWVEDPEPARDAARIARRLLTRENLGRQSDGELIGGVAGLLCALVAVDTAADRLGLDFDVVAPARACGRFLQRLTRDGRPALGPGFGHGLSGVAWSLIRLHELDPADEWPASAHDAFAAERRLYDPRQGLWRRPVEDRPEEQNAWCRGAGGMLMARSGAKARGLYPDDPESRLDFERCLEAVETQPPRPRDHLCCGSLGLALILDQTAGDLGRDDLAARAHGIARRVALRCPQRLITQGSEAPTLGHGVDPGLMGGLAGMGYALLRFARPRLPNILRLDGACFSPTLVTDGDLGS